MNVGLEAKYLGSMVGSALGDAIGELAFRHPEQNALSEVVARLETLRYTDDTAMAMGLATSLAQLGKLDGQHLGETFRCNFQLEPWRGYGSGPPTVFTLVHSQKISYDEAAQRLFGGTGSFGNGAAMRIAPLGLFFYDSPDIYSLACASAGVTHAHPVGKDGAAVQALAVAQAVKLAPEKTFLAKPFVAGLIEFSRTCEIREKMKLVEKLLNENASPAVAATKLGRSVTVQDSLPFAIYSFLCNHSSFEDCLHCAIMHGGDRDTLGAMAGAVSGAYLGMDGVPPEWRSKLENITTIEKLALELARKRVSDSG